MPWAPARIATLTPIISPLTLMSGPRRLDLEQGEVGVVAAGNDEGVERGAVTEADADDVDVLDDVVVGDDVAARVDEDAGAHAVDAALRRGHAELLDRGCGLHGAL